LEKCCNFFVFFCLQYQVKSKELIEVSSPSSDVLQALVFKRKKKKKKTMKVGKEKKIGGKFIYFFKFFYM
jgi:hypothetical protein